MSKSLTTAERQKQAINWYDKFAYVYDWISSESYYRKPREFAIAQLRLSRDQTILNVPCGTGQNLHLIQDYLQGTGTVLGVDLSSGMLARAERKVAKAGWTNVLLEKQDATSITQDWLAETSDLQSGVDAVLCDLGLSGFPNWEHTIDNLLSVLKPRGRFVIMDWFIAQPKFRGSMIKWFGKGEVDRPLWQYLQPRVDDFLLDDSFKGGDVFVAAGSKPGSV